jgi:hypothetical protein
MKAANSELANGEVGYWPLAFGHWQLAQRRLSKGFLLCAF